MAEIIPIQPLLEVRTEMWQWLCTNVSYEHFLIDNKTITFINDDDATAFCLRFGAQSATQNPSLLNRKRL